jgi:hypothetical protein
MENALEIRKLHIKHEASIKSIGVLYYLAALLTPLAGLAVIFGDHQVGVGKFVVGALLVLLGFAYFKLGGWIRKLNAKAKTPATILACVGLIGFPFGTLINAYIIYLIQSKKGAFIFSDDYKAVIEATPEIKYKTSKIIWALLIIVALFIVLAIFGTIFGTKTH